MDYQGVLKGNQYMIHHQMLTYFDKLTFLGLLVPQVVVFYLSSPLCQNAKWAFLHSQILNSTLWNCKLHYVIVTLPICWIHFIFQAAPICFILACPKKKYYFARRLKFIPWLPFFSKIVSFFPPTHLPMVLTSYLQGYLPTT